MYTYQVRLMCSHYHIEIRNRDELAGLTSSILEICQTFIQFNNLSDISPGMHVIVETSLL